MKKPDKQKIQADIRREALKDNYKQSLKVSRKVIKELEEFLIMFLKLEEIQERFQPRSKVIDIKALTNNEAMLEQCAAIEIVKFLVFKYGLAQKQGEG